MAKNKLNATQKKLLEIIEKSEELSKLNNNNKQFDFPCTNDYCSGKNGMRAVGIAWRTKRNGYEMFCFYCGQENKMSREEFKLIKEKLSREEALQNMEKERIKREEENKIKDVAA